MENASTIPARRSLLDRPQRLGFLPTMWFWNNWDAQRLLLPFVLLFTVPAFLLFDALRMRAGLDTWVSIVPSLAISYLTMGLVERHLRAQAQLRSVEKIADAPPLVAHSAQTGRALMISMAVVSGALTVLLLLQVGPAVLGAAAVCGVALIATTLWRGTSPRQKSGVPQRWGIAPTHEFWVLAAPTPIGLIALIGFVGTLLALLLVLGHVLYWWQQILLVPVLFWLWQGVVERCARMYLRRQRANRPVEAPAADPGLAPRPEYEKQLAGILPTTDFWATKAERWFGRAAKPVSFAFELLWWASACSPFWQLWIVAYLITPLTLGLIERTLRRHEQRRLANRSTETASISA